MANCYINGIGSVGIQPLGFDLFQDTPQAIEPRNKAVHPDYKKTINSSMLRRMAPGVKMSLHAAMQAMQEARITQPDAIITGTGLGCLQDSEKFLNAVLDQDEEYLAPTSFIQSTHNAVGAQIALHLGCKAYNFTYVQGASAFESALLDAWQQSAFQDRQVLVGGVDESAPGFDKLFELAGRYKGLSDQVHFKNPVTAGVPASEGANFFVLSNQRSNQSYARLLDVHYFNHPRVSAMTEVDEFLERNGRERSAIDILFLGYNADQQQQHYFDSFAALFPTTCHGFYQHISGSFDTASAFGLKAAAEIVRRQRLPESLIYRGIKPQGIETILLINQAQGTDYSFVLLEKC